MNDLEKLNKVLRQLHAVNQAYNFKNLGAELLKLDSILQIIGETHNPTQQSDDFSVHDTHSQRDGE